MTAAPAASERLALAPLRSGSRRAGLAMAVSLLLASCTQQQMDDQPRLEAFEAASRFPSNQAVRPWLPGTVSRSTSWGDVPSDNPRPVTTALLKRGRALYESICAPCHGLAGYGDGMVVRHGFPAPPSYHQARLRAVSDGYVFGVITRGYGVMYPYANRVQESERWALIAYLRALQLSQWVDAAGLDRSAQDALAEVRGEPDRLRPRPPPLLQRPPLPSMVPAGDSGSGAGATELSR